MATAIFHAVAMLFRKRFKNLSANSKDCESTVITMRKASLLNTRIGDYMLVDFLGAGGMGEVYRAVHSKIGRVAAIKILSLDGGKDGWHERFINEARIQARLQHSGIATLYDYSEVAGHPCIIMEYVAGQTLEEYIRLNGPLPVTHALNVFSMIAEAINYIHQHSVVHRDIKSNNIKISPQGEVKLLDFGIAKSDSSPNLTCVGSVIGTFQYMSPEQLRGASADARSDIWALGVLFYEMLTGRVPFQAETLESLFEMIKNTAYPRPSDFDPTIPKELEQVIARCLKKQPSARYQSVAELLNDISRLKEFCIDEKPGFMPTMLPQVQGHAKFLAAIATVLVLMMAVFYVWASREPSPTGNLKVIPATEAQASEKTDKAPTEKDFRLVKVQAFGGEAEVYKNDEKVGVTPYEIREPLGKRIDLVLKRKGYLDKPVMFFVTENKSEYNFSLDPVSNR